MPPAPSPPHRVTVWGTCPRGQAWCWGPGSGPKATQGRYCWRPDLGCEMHIPSHKSPTFQEEEGLRQQPSSAVAPGAQSDKCKGPSPQQRMHHHCTSSGPAVSPGSSKVSRIVPKDQCLSLFLGPLPLSEIAFCQHSEMGQLTFSPQPPPSANALLRTGSGMPLSLRNVGEGRFPRTANKGQVRFAVPMCGGVSASSGEAAGRGMRWRC